MLACGYQGVALKCAGCILSGVCVCVCVCVRVRGGKGDSGNDHPGSHTKMDLISIYSVASSLLIAGLVARTYDGRKAN